MRRLNQAIAMAVILAMVAGCSSKPAPTEKRMNQAARAVPVEVKKAAVEDFRMSLSLSGRAKAKEQVDLTSKASGRIKQLLVRVGDPIKAGQAIAQLDDEEGKVQLQKAQASLLLAKARYDEAREGTRAENLAQSQNQLIDAQNKFDSARKDYERTQTLFKEGAVSAADLDKAKAALDSATTTLENQKLKLKLDQEGPTQTSIEAAEASYKQAQADAALSQLTFDNYTIKSPITGVVGSLPVDVGGTVSGSTVVAQIVNMNSMIVQTHVSESQVQMVHNDQSVEVKVAAIDLATKGKVTAVSPIADSTKSFPVEIEIPNPDLKIKVGMVASISLQGEPHKSVVVPREAVISSEKKNYVYVVDGDVARQVEVTVGESDGERIEVLSGLSGGEDVVTKGNNTLTEGTPVVVFDPNKPAAAGNGQKGWNQGGGNGKEGYGGGRQGEGAGRQGNDASGQGRGNHKQGVQNRQGDPNKQGNDQNRPASSEQKVEQKG